mgnify:CR=1 FL=1
MRVSTVIIGLVSALILDGCGITAMVRARNDMEESKAAYKGCLLQHSQDPSKCEAVKQAFETDLAVYRATSGVLTDQRIDINQSIDVKESKYK